MDKITVHNIECSNCKEPESVSVSVQLKEDGVNVHISTCVFCNHQHQLKDILTQREH